MARMEARVNLRLSKDTLQPYERLAHLLTTLGLEITPTQLIRTLVEEQVEQVEFLCSYAEKAAQGDKAAAHAVIDKILDWNQAYLDLARSASNVEVLEQKQA